MILNMKAENFEEYIESLPRKDGRAVMHDLRRIADQGISVTRHQTLSAEDLNVAERLYRAVEAR